MKKNLILEVRDKLIKVCAVDTTKRKRVIVSLSVVEFEREVTSGDIRDVFLSFSRKTSYDKIVISLPRKSFLIRYLKLPSQDMAEIKAMLPFQLAKKMFAPLEEIIYDFSIIRGEQGYSKIVLFLIPKNKQNHLVDFIKQKKENQYFVTITSWGLNCWYLFQKRFSKSEDKRFLILVDIDRDGVEFLVNDEETILFSREFGYLGEDDLSEGIRQSITIFEKEFGRAEFSKIVFTGIKKESVLNRGGGIETVFIDGLENYSIAKNLEGKIDKNIFSYASILGLSADNDLSRFDFSPADLKEKRAEVKKSKVYSKLFILGIEILLVLGMFIGKGLFDNYRYLDFLNSKLQEIKIEAKELYSVADKIRILDREIIASPRFSEIAYDLIAAVPQNTQLTLLEFQENGEFSVKGYAEDNSSVFAMKASLNAAEVFEDVKINYASKLKQGSRDLVEFYIYGKIKVSKN